MEPVLAPRVVPLTDAAFRALRGARRPEESYSQTVERLCQESLLRGTTPHVGTGRWGSAVAADPVALPM